MSPSKDCQSVRGLLMLYLDSELDATATHRVNQHLVRCPSCRHRFEAEQLLESAIAAGLEEHGEDMPNDVWERLTANLAGLDGTTADGAAAAKGTSAVPGQTLAAAQAATRFSADSAAHKSWRLSWPTIAGLAAAAMVVAAVTLWFRDSGVQGSPRSSGLVQQLVALHRASSATADREPLLAARAVLAELSLPDSMVPASTLGQLFEGHSVRLVGAERVQLDDVTALDLHYDCCGMPASVFIIPRGELQSLPSQALPGDLSALGAEGVESTVDGLLTRSVLSAGAFVSVISEHSVVLADAWSS